MMPNLFLLSSMQPLFPCAAILFACYHAHAAPPGDLPAQHHAFDGTRGADGVSASWEMAGGDYVDVFRQTADGTWSRVLDSTTRTEVKGLDGDSLRFSSCNPKMWYFRSVAKDQSIGANTSVACDPDGNPAICYVADTQDGDEVRLMRFKNGRWTTKRIAQVEAQCVGLAYLPNGNAVIAYDDLEVGELRVAIEGNDEQWNDARFANYSEFVLAVSPAGVPEIAYIKTDDDRKPHSLVLSRKTAEDWVDETVVASEGNLSAMSLAHSADGRTAIAYLHAQAGDASIRFSRQTDDGWREHLVSTDWFIPSLGFDSKANPVISASSADKGLRLFTLVGGDWKEDLVDLAPCGLLSVLAYDSSGRPGILYQSNGRSQWEKLKFASHDGIGWHSSSLWSAGGDAGLSLAFDSESRPVFSSVDESRQLLRFGTLVPLNPNTRPDNDPQKPDTRPVEMAIEGKILPIEKGNVIGEWIRADPTRPGEHSAITMAADGGFSYGLGGGISSVLLRDRLVYRGVFDFSGGVITGQWQKKDNPSAFADEEEMKIKVVSVTTTHIALEFQAGVPVEVFMRKK